MNDCIAQAAALIDILASGTYKLGKEPFGEATIACSTELIQAGEPERALDLCEIAIKSFPNAGMEWRARILVSRARALMATSRFQETLELVATIEQTLGETLKLLPRDLAILRISRAACYRQTNRVDQAVEELAAVRAELLSQPDSYLLGWCSYQLAAVGAGLRCLRSQVWKRLLGVPRTQSDRDAGASSLQVGRGCGV